MRSVIPRTLVRPTGLRRRVLLLGAVALGLTGCAGPAKPGPSPTPVAGTPTPTTPTTTASTPTPTPADPVAAFARQRLAQMTLEQKVASLFLLHRPGTDAADLNAFAAATGAGGLILMGDNVPDSPAELAAQTAAMSPDPELPLLLGIDEEGGDVTRLPWDTAAGADALQAQPTAATSAAFAERAAVVKNAGVTLNFGVVADVSTGPDSFIDSRSYGRDPLAAADRVAAAVTAERGVVLSTLKHFPGHGAAPGDSHTSVPATAKSLEQWRGFDAVPFERGIRAGAEFVMMGHLAYTAVDAAPASLSPEWHRILRDELGFDGVVITDDMRMLQDTGLPEYQDAAENAVRALAAGCTLLLYVLPADPSSIGADPTVMRDAVATAVRSGRIDAARIDAAALKLLTVRRSLALT
ncbi:glycoside hydrolase family 3 protein [Microbacteriaceae bacterium VKM Ac-2854]|nr:glycoside hydrolase family 3 protein [Microbacteriaceae bacterium VKM Ac-2854]